MSSSEEPWFEASKFSGVVRLFPLPNLVVFPHAIQPLHIFEPRYRLMLEEALAGDHFLAMATLLSGWEKDTSGRPPIYPIACLGRVAAHRRLDDGRYNILFVGLKRIGILSEFPLTKAFREARVEVYDDTYPKRGAALRSALRDELRAQFKRLLGETPASQEPLAQLLDDDFPLGPLSDVVAHALKLDISLKQRLLRECNVDRRARMLLDCLAEIAGPDDEISVRRPQFPPDFSEN